MSPGARMKLRFITPDDVEIMLFLHFIFCYKVTPKGRAILINGYTYLSKI
jgi:hypothetical protein